MLARNSNLLSLQPTKEGNVVVPAGRVLPSALLTLPFENESRVAERRRLEKVITSGEGKEERKVLR